jgi:hypothetical protein
MAALEEPPVAEADPAVPSLRLANLTMSTRKSRAARKAPTRTQEMDTISHRLIIEVNNPNANGVIRQKKRPFFTMDIV